MFILPHGRIAPRSGLALEHGIHVGAGVIDPDYRGEVKVECMADGKFDEVFMRWESITKGRWMFVSKEQKNS